MKLILIPLLLLLASCSQYRYEVMYEKCNGKQGFGTYVGTQDPYIDTYKEAVPILRMSNYTDKVINVCEFSYTRNEIK